MSIDIDLREAETVEKGGSRRIALSSEAVDHLDWRRSLERRREIRGRESVEIIYLITSLPPEKAVRLMALARAHGAIENRLHYVRDVSFNEDRCRSRAAARPLASLRNLATQSFVASQSLKRAKSSAKTDPMSYRPSRRQLLWMTLVARTRRYRNTSCFGDVYQSGARYQIHAHHGFRPQAALLNLSLSPTTA